MEDNTYQSPVPPPSASQAVIKSTSGLGLTALILGVLSLIISWVPIINNLAAIIALVGLVLGLFAIRSTRPNGKKSGRGISIAGTILCVLALLITLGTQYLYGKVLDEAGKALDKPAAVASKDTSTKKDTKKSETGLIAGKYLVENVKVKKTGRDHKGKQTVVISYDMTNKSDKKSNMFDVQVKVFQNKSELENAIYIDPPSGYDMESPMKEILPGGKKTVTEGFVLTSDDAPVVVEITPTIDFSDDAPKIMKEFPIK